MSCVLICVDHSQATERVVRTGVKLARNMGYRAVLLHVAQPEPEFVGWAPGPQSQRDAIAAGMREQHRQLEGWAESLRSEQVDVQHLLVRGPTSDTILGKARELDVECIVIGSHGHGAVYELLVGSTAHAVLKEAAVPVMVVPARS